jgi:hypothetical protein
MSSCWPQWQSVDRLQRALLSVVDLVSAFVFVSVRVTSLISPNISVEEETDETATYDAETPGMARSD